jgi:hypothetical protein
MITVIIPKWLFWILFALVLMELVTNGAGVWLRVLLHRKTKVLTAQMAAVRATQDKALAARRAAQQMQAGKPLTPPQKD